jgi:DNA-binding CsgD family transcriptional regulator
MTIADVVNARDRVLAADRAASSVDDVLRAVYGACKDVLAADCGAVLLTDPDTLLPFGGIVDGLDEDGCVPFWDNELLDPDFNKFTALAQSHDPVATLVDATDGDLARSPRWLKEFRDQGTVDELRVAFTAGTRCWAVGFFLRSTPNAEFTASDVQAVRDLVPVVARAIRNAVIRRHEQPHSGALAMFVVAADGEIEASTADGRRLLDEFATEGVELTTPTPVLAAARRAKSSRNDQAVTLRARGASGRWFRLHASSLGTDGKVAVVVDAASPADLVPIVLESYCLTPRETEIVPLLARGLSTKQIAAELCISRHTVSDYMKTIFEKCDVASRAELVAKVFTENILANHKAETNHY